MTIYHPELFKQLLESTILLDTNVFSTAARSLDLASFLVLLRKESNCVFATIPSVIFESTNGSSSLATYNERLKYINNTVDAVIPTNFIDDIQDFQVLMAKLNGGNKAYTDFLLAACLYKYRHTNIQLLTADIKAFPPFFDRLSIITTEQNSGHVVNFGLYHLNESSYTKALTKALV